MSKAKYTFQWDAVIVGTPCKENGGMFCIDRPTPNGMRRFYLKPVYVAGGRHVPVGTKGKLVETCYFGSREPRMVFIEKKKQGDAITLPSAS